MAEQDLVKLFLALKSLQNPMTVQGAMSRKNPDQLTPAQKERIKGDMAAMGPDKPPMQIIGGQQEMLPPTETAAPTAEQLPPGPGPGSEGSKMTVADALGLAAEGAKATGSMMPRPPRAPGLPGGGRFANIDPTTLQFLAAAMRGR